MLAVFLLLVAGTTFCAEVLGRGVSQIDAYVWFGINYDTALQPTECGDSPTLQALIPKSECGADKLTGGLIYVTDGPDDSILVQWVTNCDNIEGSETMRRTFTGLNDCEELPLGPATLQMTFLGMRTNKDMSALAEVSVGHQPVPGDCSDPGMTSTTMFLYTTQMCLNNGDGSSADDVGCYTDSSNNRYVGAFIFPEAENCPAPSGKLLTPLSVADRCQGPATKVKLYCNPIPCWGILNTQKSEVCNGHGICSEWDTCVCDKDGKYEGAECLTLVRGTNPVGIGSTLAPVLGGIGLAFIMILLVVIGMALLCRKKKSEEEEGNRA